LKPVSPLRLPALDRRLSRIAEQVPVCDLAADIGADHGKLSCHLLHTGRVKRMIVSDISQHSRDKARDLFIRHRLMDRVSLSAADGLHALDGQKADAVIIAGMGGALIARILQQDVDVQGALLLLGALVLYPIVATVTAEGWRQVGDDTLATVFQQIADEQRARGAGGAA